MSVTVSLTPTTSPSPFRQTHLVLNWHTVFISHPPREKNPEDHKVYIDSPSVAFDHAAIWLDGAAVRFVPHLYQSFR